MKPWIVGTWKLVCWALPAWAVMLTPAQAQHLYDIDRESSWVADHRASAVGDVVTVLVVETSSAESRADSARERDIGLEAGVRYPAGTPSVGMSLGWDEEGAGRTSRRGNLRAQISAQVVEVLPGGDLRLKGEQLIVVNGERQRIVLGGIARPIDIRQDNTVLSTRLAAADIRYDGAGFVHDGQRPGWLGRALAWIGL